MGEVGSSELHVFRASFRVLNLKGREQKASNAGGRRVVTVRMERIAGGLGAKSKQSGKMLRNLDTRPLPLRLKRSWCL